MKVNPFKRLYAVSVNFVNVRALKRKCAVVKATRSRARSTVGFVYVPNAATNTCVKWLRKITKFSAIDVYR